MTNKGMARVAFIPKPEELEKEDKFSFAEDVHDVAARVIDKWHSDLAEAKIVYLFKDVDTWNSKGKTVFARTCKAPEQWQFLAGCDLLVIVNKKVWERLDYKQRDALIDHELCHVLKDIDEKGNPKWSMVTHDVEEFAAVIQRHGMWMDELKKFMRVAQQMTIEELHGPGGGRE